jgi:hypothetical protein
LEYGTIEENESRGSIIISTGLDSFEVEHNLVSSPSCIQLTPAGNLIGNTYWVSNVTDSSFIIFLDNPVATDTLFYWYAFSD